MFLRQLWRKAPISTRTYNTMSNLGLVVLPPKKTPQTGTVIFCHGLGDTAYGWKDAMEMVQTKLPSVKFILPTAPKNPVTLNGGMRMTSWYDIVSLDKSDVSKEAFVGIDESRKTVQAFIEEEIKNGIAPEKIVLGGFSQGGAVTIYTAFQQHHVLGGALVLSSYVPFYHEFAKRITEEGKKTPLFMAHGDEDPLIRLEYSKESFEILKKSGVQGSYKVYEGMAHSANYEEINDVTAWLTKILK